MKFIRCYDPQFDESFQVGISDETAAKAPDNALISDTPWPNIPLKSRYQTERHPELLKDVPMPNRRWL